MSADKLKLEVLLAAVDKVTRPLKFIEKTSKETSAALKAAKDRMRELNDQQKRVDGFRTAARGIAIHRQELEKAEVKVRSIKEAMEAAQYPTKAMQQAFKHATEEARNLKGNITRLTDKQERLRRELSASGVDTHKLAAYQRELKSNTAQATTEVDKQSAALATLNQRANTLRGARYGWDKAIANRNRMKDAGIGMIGIGAATGAPIYKAIKEYAIAEDAATQLKVAMMDANGQVKEGYQQINEISMRLGDKLPGTTSDYQEMMTMLIRQGMSAKAIIGGLGQATAYLGVQLKMPMSAAAEFAAKLQDATRTTEGEMMGLMDTIQRTFYLGVDSNNMLAAFAKLSPTLSVIKKEGLAAANIFAPLLVMADQAGMRGEAAGNSYRKVFQYILDAKKLGKANEALSGTGINLDFTNGKGEFGGLDKLFSQLERLKSLNTVRRNSVLKELFGDDAETLQAVTLIIEKGKAGYEEVQAKMAAQADIQSRVNEQLGTLRELWGAASGTFTNALVALGETIAPEVKAVTRWIGEMSEGIRKFAEEHPVLSGAIMKTVAVLAVLLAVLGALAIGAGALLVPFAALKYAMAVFPAVGAVMSWISPVSKLITVFLAAYAAGSLLATGLDWFVSQILGYQTTLGGAIFDLVQWFKEASWADIGLAILRGIEWGLDTATLGLYSKIKNIGKGMLKTVKEALGIHSPSRAFSEIGGFTMQGLEQGLNNGQDGPLKAVLSTAKQITAIGAGIAIAGSAMAGDGIKIDNRPPIAAAAMQQSAGGTIQVIQHIHPAPGMDESALARLVAMEFEKITRQNAANARSRLSDRD